MSDENWPRHPDGRRMKMGEMTSVQRREVVADACSALQKWFGKPEVRAGLAAALDGDTKSPH